MAALATGVIDPTKVGKYRVVLSDALLGKDPKEVYTGVRCKCFGLPTAVYRICLTQYVR